MMKKLQDYYPEVSDRYYISDDGSAYTDYGTRKMSNGAIQNGYMVNSFYGTGYRKDLKRHVIVAKMFLPAPLPGQVQINHKDGNKLNNAASNLEWCTSKDNINHAWEHNLAHARRGSASNFAILNEEQVLEIAKLIEEGQMTGRAIAKQFGVTPSTISAIKRRRIWAHLTKDFNFQ